MVSYKVPPAYKKIAFEDLNLSAYLQEFICIFARCQFEWMVVSIFRIRSIKQHKHTKHT